MIMENIWSAIVGHESNIARLKTMLAENRLPHALLFIGAAGIGKYMVAKALAKTILCETHTACGHCASCRAFELGSHPDFHEVTPEIRGKSTKVIRIEQIRDMQSEIARLPLLSTSRVCLIDEANSLNAPAANSLLKTLEEPTGQVTFILVAASRDSLLTTIVSRTMAISFNTLPLNDMVLALMKNGLSEKDAKDLAALADGSLGKAKRLEESGWQTELNEALDLLQNLPTLSSKDIWKRGERLGNWEREALADFLMYFNMMLRDLLVLASQGDSRLLYNQLLISLWSKLETTYTVSRLFALTNLVSLTRRRLEANVNLRLLMEGLLIRLRETMQPSII